MNNFTFIIRSLRFFKKQHIGVLLAIIISTAVLTGALIVGDSVKFSLKNLVKLRLGNIENVLITGDRFITDELSGKLSNELGIKTSSILLLDAISIAPESQSRINKVQLVGVDQDFWDLSDITMTEIFGNNVVISINLAEKLNLKVSDEFLLRVRNADIVPLNAPFTDDTEQTIAIRVVVIKIAGNDELGRFSLRNDQKAPYNVFINRSYLAEKLDIPGLSNVAITCDDPKINIADLNKALKSNFTFRDAGLQISNLNESTYIDLSSSRIFIDNSISRIFSNSEIPHSNILTYFVNSFENEEKETPYSFISAVPDGYLEVDINENGIVVNSWLAADLNLGIGDSLTLKYFIVGPLRTLKEASKCFIVQDIISVLELDNNRTLMPEFPGLSNAESCGDWDAGIPIDMNKIRDKDEDYWNTYKGTPKAFISLDVGSSLWKNEFGDYTTIRFSNKNIDSISLVEYINSNIDPKDLGISFLNVRSIGNAAATNGVDFGELFLSLSFFIILSAIILTILITSLNLQSRMSEVGILSSLGISKNQILGLRFKEYSIIIIVGSIIGALCGISYNYSILYGLNSIWNDAIHADGITMRIIPSTVIMGIIIGMITSSLSIYITTSRMLRRSGKNLISKQRKARQKSSHIFQWVSAVTMTLLSVAIAIYSLVEKHALVSSVILIAGFIFMLGSIWLMKLIIGNRNNDPGSILTFHGLAARNIGRNIGRSITVVSLLAIGSFTIIVTGSNRLTFTGTELQKNSGTGGFSHWVENTIPILKKLNSKDGRSYYGIDKEFMNDINFVQMASVEGDDASCLNLNQVQNPRILGVPPHLFDSLNAFSFATVIDKTENPWLSLNDNLGQNVIPAIADQTVIQWGLIKSIGDTLLYTNEVGDNIYLVLVGGLAPSIFQGNILISEKHIIKNFPSSAGSKIMLVDSPEEHSDRLQALLSDYFTDFGIEITSAPQRLVDFYSVTNTYLSIFMILGGLGVVLGTFGLGIVIIRNLVDRKFEIETYYALGYGIGKIKKVILIENLILLTTGLVIGIFAAIIAIIPSLISQSYNIPGNFIYLILIVVTLNGLLWIYIPTSIFLKKKKFHNLSSEN